MGVFGFAGLPSSKAVSPPKSARAHAKRNRVPNSTSSQKDYYLIRNNDVMSFPNRQAYAKKADMGKFITLDKLASKFMEVKKKVMRLLLR